MQSAANVEWEPNCSKNALSCSVEESFKEFLDLDSDAVTSKNLMGTSVPEDKFLTSLVKFL